MRFVWKSGSWWEPILLAFCAGLALGFWGPVIEKLLKQ